MVLEVEGIPAVTLMHDLLPLGHDRFKLMHLPFLGRELPFSTTIELHLKHSMLGHN